MEMELHFSYSSGALEVFYFSLLMYPKGMFILIINHPEGHAKEGFNIFLWFGRNNK